MSERVPKNKKSTTKPQLLINYEFFMIFFFETAIWFHFLNGNISKESSRACPMKRAWLENENKQIVWQRYLLHMNYIPVSIQIAIRNVFLTYFDYSNRSKSKLKRISDFLNGIQLDELNFLLAVWHFQT